MLKAPTGDDTAPVYTAGFTTLQHAQIDTFRAHHPAGEKARVSQGLIVIPSDTATPGQRAKYAAYVEARTPRTARPKGPAKCSSSATCWARPSRVTETLYAHAGFRAVDEVVFALPFGFDHADYVQILTDKATRLGPAPGWSPRDR